MAGPSYSRIRDEVPVVVVTSPSTGAKSQQSSPSRKEQGDTVLFERDSFESTNTSEIDMYPPHPDGAQVRPQARRKRSNLVFLVPACVLLLLVISVVQPVSVTSAMQKATEVVHKATAPPFATDDDLPQDASEDADLEQKPAEDPQPEVGMDVVEEEDAVKGVSQREIVWSAEDQELRRYSWGRHEPHSSLESIVGQLDSDSKRIRAWLLEARPAVEAGTGIGMGQAIPPEPIRPARPASAPRGLPSADEGPGVYTGGSYEKYGWLLEEWQTGRPATPCAKGQWEDKYTVMHDEMMKGKRPAKLLEYRCFTGHGCGGLADRLLGMMTAFLYSILSERAISVSWEHPVPFDMLFDSPNVDWSYPWPNSTSTPHPIYSDPSLIEKRTEFNALNWLSSKIDVYFPGVPEAWSTFKEPWIRFLSNRGFVLRAFSYPSVAETLRTLGLRHNTAYSCMLNYLIRPKPDVLNYIAEYTSLFSLPKFFTVAVQVRTGDASMADPEADKLNTVKRHRAFFKCAEQAGRSYARSDQRVLFYLISDSEHLKADALATWPDKVVVSGLGIRHTEFSKGGGIFGVLDGMMNSIAEMWTIAGTDFQVLTERSGFGKIPTWLRGRPGATAIISKPGTVHRPPAIDCGLDVALVSYTDLAATWSLGR